MHCQLALEGTGTSKEEDTISDPELLMEVMDAREVVETTEDVASLTQLRDSFSGKEKDCIKVIASHVFVSTLADTGQAKYTSHQSFVRCHPQGLSEAFTESDLTSANKIKIRLQYVRRILEAISTKM